jgi:hypothetical protein
VSFPLTRLTHKPTGRGSKVHDFVLRPSGGPSTRRLFFRGTSFSGNPSVGRRRRIRKKQNKSTVRLDSWGLSSFDPAIYFPVAFFELGVLTRVQGRRRPLNHQSQPIVGSCFLARHGENFPSLLPRMGFEFVDRLQGLWSSDMLRGLRWRRQKK